MSISDVVVRALDAAGVVPQAVYLFGSRAREDAAPQSDFDIGLLLPRPMDPVRRWELQEQLAIVLRADVDLVDLRAASTVLQIQVLQDGILLSDAEPAARAEFEMYALSDYGRLQEERREILKDASRPGWLRG